MGDKLAEKIIPKDIKGWAIMFGAIVVFIILWHAGNWVAQKLESVGKGAAEKAASSMAGEDSAGGGADPTVR
ncbi:hypothetical protein ES703_96213 [subsurface metagenome]